MLQYGNYLYRRYYPRRHQYLRAMRAHTRRIVTRLSAAYFSAAASADTRTDDAPGYYADTNANADAGTDADANPDPDAHPDRRPDPDPDNGYLRIHPDL